MMYKLIDGRLSYTYEVDRNEKRKKKQEGSGCENE